MVILDRPTIHVGEVDGVRAVWADVPGPLRAGLVVRVGTADETLTTAGISHTLEHLALFGTGRPGDHSNGSPTRRRPCTTAPVTPTSYGSSSPT